MTVKGSLYAFSLNVKRYVRENWGAPFIVGFIVLLVVAAVSLSMGLSASADVAANYAFYALAIGVVFQLACYLKYDRRSNEIS
jgi:heme/copper-type cytochrome/quinol oxidase subunit 4